MNVRHRQDFFLLGFFICSLLLHLLILYLLPQREWFAAPERRVPMVVEVRPPQPPKPRDRELDLPVTPAPAVPREKPARRLGPSDRVVPKETAPKGDAPEDRRPDAPLPQAAARKPVRPMAPSPPLPRPEPRAAEPEQRPAPPAVPPEAEPKPIPLPPSEIPDLQSLLQLPDATVARLDEEWRRKYRKDVEEGDAVWLDTEKDLLISFFQRFRTNIYGVWNYPARARERGEEGTCLLRITVNRDGSLRDVKVMESSGYRTLDEEAMAAVRKGSPFGPLPRSYTQETLSVYAFFQYHLLRRAIY